MDNARYEEVKYNDVPSHMLLLIGVRYSAGIHSKSMHISPNY